MISYAITISILYSRQCSTIVWIKRIVDSVTIGVDTSRYSICYAVTISIMAFYSIRNTVAI